MMPKYDYGTEVRVIRNVRNDGTYPGMETGTLLISRGSVGCVVDVGTYLQDQLIYRVHFLEGGMMVGCREEELILASDPWIANEFEFQQKVKPIIPIVVNGECLIDKGQKGSVVKILRDVEKQKVNYHVYFEGKTYQLPEAALEASE